MTDDLRARLKAWIDHELRAHHSPGYFHALHDVEAALDRLAAVAPPQEAEQLARQFHEAYERLAPGFGYRTREASAKPWSDVPDENRRLMIVVCAELLGGLPAEPGTRQQAEPWKNLRGHGTTTGDTPKHFKQGAAVATPQEPATFIHEPGCPAIADDESDEVLYDYGECACPKLPAEPGTR